MVFRAATFAVSTLFQLTRPKPLFSFCIVLLSILATECRGSLQVGSVVRMSLNPPGSIGGQNRVEDPGNASGFGFSSFLTFCVELEELFVNLDTYSVTGVSRVTTTGRALTPHVAYLYSAFRAGTLPNFDPQSEADADALQYAIWRGMGYTHQEILAATGTGPRSGRFQTAVRWQPLWNLPQDVEFHQADRVRIMQLGDNQDQLVMIPEPVSLAIWSGISLAFGLILTRFNRSV